jgi:hypothetical protein
MGGGQTTPLGWSGGGRVAKGVVWPPPKGHKEKKKKKGFVLWEWPDHPLRPWGWLSHPQTGRMWVAEPPPWAKGVVQPPPKGQKKKKKKKNGFWLFGVAGPPL